MEIKTVAVLGAGAVGSYVIWGLSRRKDIRLGVIAEGERAERMKKGCLINGTVYHPEVWTPQDARETDLLIVALKYGALPAALNIINLRLDITHLYYPAKNSFQKGRLKRREIFTELLLYTLTT